MEKGIKGKKLWVVAALVGALLLRYGMGLAAPFLLGGVLALTAEPLVRRLEGKRHFSRKLASAVSVSFSLLMGAAVVYWGGRAAVQGLSRFVENLPDLQGSLQTVRRGLHSVAEVTPGAASPLLHRLIEEGFANGQDLLGKAATAAAGSAAAWIAKLSNWAVQLGTAVLAAFLISARLPQIKGWLLDRLPNAQNGIQTLHACKKALFGWGKAQLKLMVLCFGVVSAGLYIIGIRNALFVGALVALVDAVPMLGTGTVLVPWALVQFLQGNAYKGVGLCLLFGVSFLLRAFLEPRLVGKQMGLDPLTALIAIYLGLQIWGIFGMLLFPVAFAVGKTLYRELF